MTVTIVSCVAAGIIFSALLVTVLCMFSSQINQQQERAAWEEQHD
jgi:hypothetical protein